MKQCIALAGLVCLLASGCAQTGLMGNNDAACHVARSRNAPRPLITRSGAKPSARLFGGGGQITQCSASSDCDCGDSCWQTGDCCQNGQCGPCGAGGCCVSGRCQCLVEGVASGFCGACGCGPGGVCPHAGGYPEYQAFNPGPPTGQVAYPYYTVRGPRDFLRNNPPTIGPN